MPQSTSFHGREISAVSPHAHVVRIDSAVVSEFGVERHHAGLDHEVGECVRIYLNDHDEGDMDVLVRNVGNSLGITLEAGICRLEGIDDETLASHRIVNDDPETPVIEFTFQKPAIV